MKIKNIGKLFLLVIIMVFNVRQAQASIYVQGVNIPGWGHQCPDPDLWGYYWADNDWSYMTFDSSATCPLRSNRYVPKTGYYRIETYIETDYYSFQKVDSYSQYFYLDATKTISAQTIHASLIPGWEYSPPIQNKFIFCEYLVDDSGNRYIGDSATPHCTWGTPLPPTPPQPDISCTINNGNALTVNLGTVDRAQLPTVASSGTATAIPIPIACTGGNLTVNMKLSYTPITSGSSQAVKSSANGVGVAILYNDKMLSSTDNTSVNLLAGSNALNLAFEAVRDASVEIKDIPTGAFSASAVLQMTQQ